MIIIIVFLSGNQEKDSIAVNNSLLRDTNKFAGRSRARAQRWWKMDTGTQWAAKSTGGIFQNRRGDRNPTGASTRSKTGTQRFNEDLTMRGVLADLK